MISNLCCHFLIILLLVLAILVQLGTCRSKVEELPGFEGPLPFELETGYVGLGERDEDMQVFYYFLKSENDPHKDPLMLWLSGGPGCSSLSGLLFQIGPLALQTEAYDGSMPNLILRPQSWTKWLIDHPEFLLNEFYMGGDSYSGIPVPGIVQEISNGNEIGLQPQINLQGYLLGNPVTTGKENNYQISFAHGMGLISDELYASLQRNCKGEYIDIDSRNELCLRDMNYFEECLSEINIENILEHCCKVDLPKKQEAPWRRYLYQKFEASLNSYYTKKPKLCCNIFSDFISAQWANDESVRKSLHTREGTIGKWERCYKTDFKFQISSSFHIHVNLSAKGYRSLIYSGDHDAVVPFISTQAWIRALNYSIVEDWRPWLIEGQVAGYTRTYSNQMTFATMKGSGHIVSEYTPEEGFAMFTRWIANLPL